MFLRKYFYDHLMTTKTIKTILFASLIAAMILPFSGMNYAEANLVTEDTERSDEKYAFLEKSVSQIGEWTETKTNGEYTEYWYWDVKENNNKKHVKLNIQAFDGNGNQVADDLIKFKVTYDEESDTYTVDNEKLKETKHFQKSVSTEIGTNGFVVPGSSTIVVGDWTNVVVASGFEFGADDYSQCGNNWYVDFTTKGSTDLRSYDYSGPYNYLDWCIFADNLDTVQIYASQGTWSESDWSSSQAAVHTEYDIDMNDLLYMKIAWYY